jgi:hypothetical protein
MLTNRVHDHAPAVAVGHALALIPSAMSTLTACEFVIGVDPNFAGIHSHTSNHTEFAYKDLAHCVYPHNQPHRPASDRGTKVVLPSNAAYHWGTWYGVETVVHELGHVLHERIGFDHIADPVSEYAETDQYEAFAEAFAAWVWHNPIDPRTLALFDGLV